MLQNYLKYMCNLGSICWRVKESHLTRNFSLLAESISEQRDGSRKMSECSKNSAHKKRGKNLPVSHAIKKDHLHEMKIQIAEKVFHQIEG